MSYGIASGTCQVYIAQELAKVMDSRYIQFHCWNTSPASMRVLGIVKIFVRMGYFRWICAAFHTPLVSVEDSSSSREGRFAFANQPLQH